MKEKNMSYAIKLPSNTHYVTTKNIWKISKIIADTGRVFTPTDLVKKGSPINEKNLFRILAYMKYLGLLNEKRDKIEIKGKKQSIQKWCQEERKDVADFFFYLQDNRFEDARKNFKKLISGHDIFKSIKEELMKNRPIATTVELKDFFRNKTPGKVANYYAGGVNFVISLLEECGLIIFDVNKISLVPVDKIEKVECEVETKEVERNESSSPIVEKNKFLITIVGKDTNFSFPINTLSDLEDVESIISILKKKLN